LIFHLSNLDFLACKWWNDMKQMQPICKTLYSTPTKVPKQSTIKSFKVSKGFFIKSTFQRHLQQSPQHCNTIRIDMSLSLELKNKTFWPTTNSFLAIKWSWKLYTSLCKFESFQRPPRKFHQVLVVEAFSALLLGHYPCYKL